MSTGSGCIGTDWNEPLVHEGVLGIDFPRNAPRARERGLDYRYAQHVVYAGCPFPIGLTVGDTCNTVRD